MIIKQEKVFKPVTITLETESEYIAFVQIVDEAERFQCSDREFMGEDADKLIVELSNHFSEGG
jgi:hypothetical protein